MSKKVHNGLPAEPGYYWAKWKIASEGTEDGDFLTPDEDWSVVHVVKSFLLEGPYLKVDVTGISAAQELENFYWGDGPLKPPE